MVKSNASSNNENEIRGAIKSLNVLNVYFDNYKMCIASEMIKNKTNKITAIPTILKRINVKAPVVIYEYFQIEDVKWYTDYKSWNKLHSLGLVEKTLLKIVRHPLKKDFIFLDYLLIFLFLSFKSN